MSRSVPTPPPPSTLRPLEYVWHAGDVIVRAHSVIFGATQFNPNHDPKQRGRFHPIYTPTGASVPTLYGASAVDGALAESVFRHVPIRGRWRRIRESSLVDKLLSYLRPRRDLVLAQLSGVGLRRLKLRRSEIIEPEAVDYVRTARWAEAIYGCKKKFDGLVWTSRLDDTCLALVLFGTRVASTDFDIVSPSEPLALPPGLDRVRSFAMKADIEIISP